MQTEQTAPTNPSQGILDNHNDRTRILAELGNPNLADEDRKRLHNELRTAEDNYAAEVTKAGDKKIPPAK